jgi:ornithine carbamoyltransferase
MKHMLHFKNWTGEELLDLVRKGRDIKKNPDRYAKALEGKTLAMVFQKTSTRTRGSFEAGMTQLGGHAIYLDWRTTNFVLADIRDETRCLDKYVDIIMARLPTHAELEKMANVSRVPVVNGCCEKYHPTQILADLLTIYENKHQLMDTQLTYVGVHNNVCNSLIEGCTKTGIHITTVTPEINEPSLDKDLLTTAEKTGLYKKTMNLQQAVKDTDFIYTDSWVDMEFFSDPKFEHERKRRIDLMMPYQINEALLESTKALVLHDLPAHRGYEITDSVIEDPRCITFQQAENRMHAEKALMLELIGN